MGEHFLYVLFSRPSHKSSILQGCLGDKVVNLAFLGVYNTFIYYKHTAKNNGFVW